MEFVESVLRSKFSNEHMFRKHCTAYFGNEFKIDSSDLKEEVAIKINGSNKRIDFLYKDIMIEYKASGVLKSEETINKAVHQLLEYASEYNRQNDSEVGKLFVLSPEKLVFIRTFKSIDHYEKMVFDLGNKNVQKLINILLSNSFKSSIINGSLELNTENIRDKFNPYNSQIMELTSNICDIISKTGTKPWLLFNDWKRLFAIVTGDSSSSKSIAHDNKFSALNRIVENEDDINKILFSLQTVYAMIVDCFILRVTTGDGWESKFLEADSLKSKYFSNSRSTQHYSWYKEKDLSGLNSDNLNSLFNIVNSFDIFDLQHLSRDILIDIYNSMIPHDIRKMMGEFYTPTSFIKKFYNHYIKSEVKPMDLNKNFIDPACGSGAFIIEVMKMRRNNGASDVNEITKGLCGLDINPLGILSAKANVIFLLHEHAKAQFESSNSGFDKVFLNFFIGDSVKLNDKSGAYIIDVPGGEPVTIHIPDSLLDRGSFESMLDRVDDIRKFSSRQIGGYRETLNIMTEYVKESEKCIWEDTIDKLSDLHAANLNGVWLEIAYNYIFAKRIGEIEKFDYVVGNPPWVKWGNLPDGYRQQLKDDGHNQLFSPYPNSGGNSLDLYAPIIRTAMMDKLAPNGELMMIMPQSLNFNSSLETVRHFKYMKDDYSINEIVYFDSSNRVFDLVQIDFAWYRIGPELKDKKVIEFSKKENKFIDKYPVILDDKAKVIVAFDSKEQYEHIKPIIGTHNYNIRSGVEFSPNKIKQYSAEFVGDYAYIKSAKVRKIQKLDVKNIEGVKVEASSLIKILRTKNIRSSNADFNYSWFAYEEGSKQEINFEVFENRWPLMAAHINSLKGDLSDKSGFNSRISKSKWFGNTRVGTYTTAKYKVCMPDNGRFAVSFSDDWREVPEGHVRFISSNDKHGVLSRDKMEEIYKTLSDPRVQILVDKSSLDLNVSYRKEYFKVKI